MTVTKQLLAATLATAFAAPVLAQSNENYNPPRPADNTTVNVNTNNYSNTNGTTATGGSATAANGSNVSWGNATVNTGNVSTGNATVSNVGNNYNGRRFLDQATYIKTDVRNLGSCDGDDFRIMWNLATMGSRPYNLVGITPNSVTFRLGQYAESDGMRKYVAGRINRELNPDPHPVNVVAGNMSISISAGNATSSVPNVNGTGGTVTVQTGNTTKKQPPVTDMIYMCTPAPQ